MKSDENHLGYFGLREELSEVVDRLKREYEFNKVDEIYKQALLLCSRYNRSKEGYSTEQREEMEALFLEFVSRLSGKLGMKKFVKNISLDNYLEAFYWIIREKHERARHEN